MGNNSQAQREAKTNGRQHLIFLPFIHETTQRIGSICKKYNLQPVYNTRNTLKEKIMKVKSTHTNKIKEDIYRIPCSEVYVGEKGWLLKVRIVEH